MGLTNNKVRWNHVEKWIRRDSMKTLWRPWGLPEIVDPHTSAFADVDPMPRWNLSDKVLISAAMNGAFFSKNANSNIPVATQEIIASAEEAIEAGAQLIHIHVRDDDSGLNVLDVDRFRRVIEPLRERHPHIAIDACLVAVDEAESAAMEKMLEAKLLDAVPVNTTAILLADNMFFKSPHAILAKTRKALEAGTKPQIAVYTDADIDNARRFLIDSNLLDPPYFWLILPALPGCSPMYSPDSMVDGLMRQVRLIREISKDSIICVCAAGRPSTYLATMAIMLGLHVRVGMEDTIYKWPHRNDRINSNAEHFAMVRDIAALLGRELMTGDEYLKLIGSSRSVEKAAIP
jgi:3-keto-5-aminohexanoate cleavage enzyme